MGLCKDITDELYAAMIRQDKVTLAVLRNVKAKAQNIAIKNKSEIDDSTMLEAVREEEKQLKQTKDMLTGREDSYLYQTTCNQIYALSKFVPRLMSVSETMDAVCDLLSGKSVTKKGNAMKIVMPQLKGKADNKVISDCVDAYIKTNSEK